MENERSIDRIADFRKTVKVDDRRALISTVSGTDGNGQGIDFRGFRKILRFLNSRIDMPGVAGCVVVAAGSDMRRQGR